MEERQIKYCVIKKDEQKWRCYIKLIGDDMYYRITVYLNDENVWDYYSMQAMYQNRWKLCLFYSPIADYVFEQVVEMVKKYSKDRIRILPYFEKKYLHGPLDPTFERKEPRTLKIKE